MSIPSPKPSEFLLMIKRASALVASRLGSGLLVLSYMSLFARSSTPSDLGHAAWSLSVILLTSILLSFNIEAGALRFLTRFRTARDQTGMAAFIWFNRIFTLAMFAIVAIAALFLIGLAHISTEGIPTHLIIVMLATSLISAFVRLTMRQAVAFDAVLQSSLPVSLSRPTAMFVVFMVLYALEHPITLEIFLYTLFGGEALGLLLVHRMVGKVMNAHLSTGDLKITSPAIVTFIRQDRNWLTWLFTGIHFVPVLLIRDNLRDVIIIAATIGLTAADLGVLLVAYSLFGLAYYAVKAVDISVGSRLAQALSDGATQKAEYYLAVIAGAKIMLVFVGALGILTLGEWVLAIFGPDYVVAQPVLLALMIIPAADALFGSPHVVLNVKGRSQVVFSLSLCAAAGIFIVTLVAGLLLPLHGVVVAAALSYFVQQGVSCRVAFLQTGVDSSALNVMRYLTRKFAKVPDTVRSAKSEG